MILQSGYDHSTGEMPYFYLPGYSALCKERHVGDILFFIDEDRNSMACKKWKSKLISFLQPLYPPLTEQGQRLDQEHEKKFLNAFVSFVKKNKTADRISQSPAFAIFHATPANSVRAPFGTYFIDLENNDADALSKNLHGKHRNVIRNAKKHQVELKYGKEVLDDFYKLYVQTMRRSKMYCEPLDFFESLEHSLRGQVICGVAYYKNEPQGALFMPYTKFGAFYLYGASAEKIVVNGAMNYLHWNTINLLREKEIKRYDFVGARLSASIPEKLRSIQQFKERFGSTLEKGYLWKMDISLTKCKAYDILLTLKLKLKGQKVPLDMISQEIQNDG